MTFQEILHTLTKYWSDQGCIFHQGHDVEVGAGTFNPATFLRSLGPEPYKCVYVEPSRRPQDGRFGENPNRLQLFHQLQVLIKPCPSDIQEKYLRSLEAIGFDLSKHDIRFVHDDWESPTLGAWGLGWEVWIDGMEVTQFTYFQSVAGFSLDPISVEITYGLERLCMLVQGVDNFFDMQFSSALSYGEVFHRNEVEWSHYNFNHASTEMWLEHFEDFEREAKRLVEINLPIPAYDFVMKASHAFNMLEARGVLSTTERMSYILRIRELAKISAIEYLNSREKLGFPLLKQTEESKTIFEPKFPTLIHPDEKSDLLIEVGSEELPATFVEGGIQNLLQGVRKLLKESKLSHGEIETFATPRRLALLIRDLGKGTHEQRIVRKGPSMSMVFDDQGHLTKQGMGFLKSLGIASISEEEVKEGHGTLSEKDGYLMAEITKPGVSTHEILYKGLPEVISKMHFPKTMRWSSDNVSFARPLRWFVALHGTEVIPFELAGVSADRFSRGHFQRSDEKIELKEASEYREKLRSAFVMADVNERKTCIQKQLDALEDQVLMKDRVLNEVLFLSEWPELATQSFSAKFLTLPQEVSISEMVEHQRYFPLADGNGKLVNRFVITADNAPNETIKINNERVLSARLSDGVFLFEQDLKTNLEAFAKKLEAVTFHKKIGSMSEKVERITAGATYLHSLLGQGDLTKLERAARLCKADLTTDLVGEFPHLQGTVDRIYALEQNEDPKVAIAIEEHWLPNQESGPLPETDAGKLLSLADKLDNLLNYFRVGLKPSSSSDPFALRRQAVGVLRILLANHWSVNLEEICSTLSKERGFIKELLEFFKNRLRSILQERFSKEEVEASLSVTCADPYDEFCKVSALAEFRKSETFGNLCEVYKRARGQIQNVDAQQLEPQLFVEDAERQLHSALTSMKEGFSTALLKKEYKGAFSHLASLQIPLANLFDQVKILAEDESIKNNRIALLQEVFAHFNKLVDLSKLG